MALLFRVSRSAVPNALASLFDTEPPVLRQENPCLDTLRRLSIDSRALVYRQHIGFAEVSAQTPDAKRSATRTQAWSPGLIAAVEKGSASSRMQVKTLGSRMRQ